MQWKDIEHFFQNLKITGRGFSIYHFLGKLRETLPLKYDSFLESVGILQKSHQSTMTPLLRLRPFDGVR